MRAVGTLERRADLGVWAIRLRDRINGAPNRLITLLPCQGLADMIDAARASEEVGETAIFEVTGRIMAWRGSNFLLVTFAVPVTSLDAPRADAGPLVPPGAAASVARAGTAPAASAPPAGAAPAASAGTVSASGAAAGASPDAAPPPAGATAPADPENVAMQLERALDSRVTTIAKSPDAQPAAPLAEPGSMQPSRAAQSVGSELSSAIREPSASEPLGPDGLPLPRVPVDVEPSDPYPAGDGVGGNGGAQQPRDAIGTLLPSTPASARAMPPQRMLDRRGTVTRDPVTGAWIFVLASGGLHEGDHAMELLPCAALDRLISMTRSVPQTMSVVLTGEVTLFEGRNFLRPVRMRALREGRWIGP